MNRLENKVAIVTGAGSGMGKAIAKLFGAHGAKVIVSDINLASAETVALEIIDHKGEAIALKTDVSNENDVKTLVDKAISEFGTLDILVNNVGIMDNMAAAVDVTNEMWNKVFAVNTTAVMYLIRAALPHMLEKENGNIINIASIGGLFGGRAGAAYTASKHAVAGYTKNTAFMYALNGIRCNAIAPGAVETNIMSNMRNINEFGAMRQAVGMGINPRTAKPEEIANVALFLASDESGFVNGTIITADAGMTAY